MTITIKIFKKKREKRSKSVHVACPISMSDVFCCVERDEQSKNKKKSPFCKKKEEKKKKKKAQLQPKKKQDKINVQHGTYIHLTQKPVKNLFFFPKKKKKFHSVLFEQNKTKNQINFLKKQKLTAGSVVKFESNSS